MRSLAVSTVAWAALFSQAPIAVQAKSSPIFLADLHPCPASCDTKPEEWTVYNAVSRLNTCNGPMLLDFNVHNPLDDPDAIVSIRACNAGGDDKVNALVLDDGSLKKSGDKSDDSEKRATKSCGSGKQSKASFQFATGGSKSSADAKSVLESLEKFLTDKSHCDRDLVFGFGNGVAVGIHSGASIDNAAVSSIVSSLSEQIDSGKLGESTLLQLCGSDRPADYTFGIAIDTSGNLAAVQKAVQTWTNATCVDTSSRLASGLDIGILEVPLVKANHTEHKAHEKLQARGDCRTISVVSGDGCGPLATKCGISPQDFTKFNPDKDLCAKLAVGQRVCCSAGTLPDLRPKPNSDGTCFSYTVGSGDYCNKIATENSLKVEDLEKFNAKTTWGWFGCDRLLSGMKMCLSTGRPPLPAPVSNALCGPTKPGTKLPTDGTNIADLNPCPLNSCCNIWGQCGITPEYCSDDVGPTGNPGTAPPGKNGCVSNCGTDIKNNDEAPKEFISVGYYEAFNWERECLNMRVADVAKKTYTHIHWAFGNINKDFTVNVEDSGKQWEDFKKLPQKKIMSFGGWGYSTSPETYDVLRQAMTPANRGTFANNVIKMMTDNGLDGIDFDWEYPGAPDIPGIPGGPETDAPNYLDFLTLMRRKMPEGKTLSIAAPASFWYLRPFPIAKMSEQLDYIVYMTYDLHGQWDFGNAWSQDGCSQGNCLRSHVNLTETNYVLSMITKAGVKANKITVGISSYGRSFGMSEAGCHGPTCHFDGTVANGGYGAGSTAKPGRCTKTAGYISNAELAELEVRGATIQESYYDKDSDSNIMVWDSTNWVAYMDRGVRASRIDLWKGKNFGGTIDWAIDLLEFTGDDGYPEDGDGLDDADIPAPCDGEYTSLDDLEADDVPQHCVALYTVMALKTIFTDSMKNYTDMLDNGYDGKFNTYSHAVADHVGTSMHDFIIKHGKEYFTCEIAELSFCCSDCGSYKDSCPYCRDDSGDSCSKFCNPRFGCLKRGLPELSGYLELSGPPEPAQSVEAEAPGKTDVVPFNTKPNTLRARDRQPIVKYKRVPEPCPPDYSKHGYGYLPDNGDPPGNSIWWKFADGKDNDFYAALLEDTGIPKDKTKIGQYTRTDSCAPSAGDDDDCKNLGIDYDIPVPDAYSADDVANPKDIVQEAQKKSQGLGDEIQGAIEDMQNFLFFGDGIDLVDSLSIPVLMIQEAVYQMAQVVEIADKIDEAKRKALILAFIGAILFLIPVVGEVLGSVAELADIAAIVTVIGEAGNVAFDVATIVDDPDNAPLAIMSLIFAPLALTNIASITKAAKFRRGMSLDDIGKLGKRVGGSLDKINKIKGKFCKL